MLIKFEMPTVDLNEAYKKVQLWFFAFPSRVMSLNELAQQLRLSKTTVHHVVLTLEREGFLQKEVLGRIWRIRCNQQHQYMLSRKVSHHLTLIYESGLLREINRYLQTQGRTPKVIILFGSYSKGDDTEESDIDIAVEVVGNTPLKIQELGIMKSFGYRKNVPIHLHIFSREHIDLNLFSNIANGIVLEGFLEVKL